MKKIPAKKVAKKSTTKVITAKVYCFDSASPKLWRWKLGERVRLKETCENGVVVARAEYLTSEDAYFVRYRAADGRQVASWWGESDLRK